MVTEGGELRTSASAAALGEAMATDIDSSEAVASAGGPVAAAVAGVAGCAAAGGALESSSRSRVCCMVVARSRTMPVPAHRVHRISLDLLADDLLWTLLTAHAGTRKRLWKRYWRRCEAAA